MGGGREEKKTDKVKEERREGRDLKYPHLKT
jgi:hypothetical protein